MRPIIGSALVTLLCLSLAAATGAARSGDDARHELLGELWDDRLVDDPIRLGRTTIAPGDAMPATRFAGKWLARVDSGALTIEVLAGEVEVDGVDGDEQPRPGGTAVIVAGTRLWFGPDAVMSWANEADVPAVVLTTAIVDNDVEPMLEVDPEALAAERSGRFRGNVVRRVVLEGPSRGLEGYRYKVTVRDRSGRVLGARVPRPSELRFLRLYERSGDPRIGPVAPNAPRGRGHEVLVTWTTSVCGPVATIDISADVSAVRVVDRSPSCDAVGMDHTVALRLRGGWTDADEVEGVVEYR